LKIAVVTTGRQDLGILRSTIRALDEDPRFDVSIWAGGMHGSRRFGVPYRAIEDSGLRADQRLDFLGEPPDPPHDTARAIDATAKAIASDRPDAILLVGDRHETLGIAMSSVLSGVPVAHLHGGEETTGALDNLFRHAITKISHLHLVSHPDHAARVIQMGEDPRAVHIVGAPGLDNGHRSDLLDRDGIEARLGGQLIAPVFLITVHPATASSDPLLAESTAVAHALDHLGGTSVITLPNADEGGAAIADFWSEWASTHERAIVVPQLGDHLYWSMLKIVDCVVGNSSSGVIEAPSLDVPSVTVGKRQEHRLRHPGVIAAPAEGGAVLEAVKKAMSEEHRRLLGTLEGPYPRGESAPRIVTVLANWVPPRALAKTFHEE